MSARIPVGYPGKPFLTEAEAWHDLRHGPSDPKLEWFEPWATRVIDMTGVNRGQYGYVHVYMRDGAFRVDSASWPDEAGLIRGLDSLWNDHKDGPRAPGAYPKCEDCISVAFFTADEPPRLLRATIEPDGVAEENPEITVVTRPIGDSTAGESEADS